MKENLPNEQLPTASLNPLQKRISLLSEKGFLWREIAELAKLPKKLIKGIAKGEYVASEEECKRMCKALDETIDRLRNNAGMSVDNVVKEDDINLQDFECLKLQVNQVSVFKGLGDDKIVIQIHALNLPDK